MNRAALIRELSEAFAGVERDPEQSLHQAQLTDQGISRNISTSEWRKAGQLDREQRWEDVADAALDECDAALSHFTPESWRFYLPAFIRRALALFAPPTYRYEKLSSALFHLTLTPERRSFVLPRLALLTPEQRMAVRHFLEVAEAETLALVERENDQWWTYEGAKEAHDAWKKEYGDA